MNVKKRGRAAHPGRALRGDPRRRWSPPPAALFAERGYAGVGTEEIVRAAGVTRGALYHHFDGKRELFEAVYEQIEAELAERIAAGALAPARRSRWRRCGRGRRCSSTSARSRRSSRSRCSTAPAVLGWDRWREIGAEHGLGLIEATLQAAIEAARSPRSRCGRSPTC